MVLDNITKDDESKLELIKVKINNELSESTNKEYVEYVARYIEDDDDYSSYVKNEQYNDNLKINSNGSRIPFGID